VNTLKIEDSHSPFTIHHSQNVTHAKSETQAQPAEKR